MYNNIWGMPGVEEDDEEDITVKPKAKCKFIVGRDLLCGSDVAYNSEYCSKHKDLKCNCGVQASHYCEERELCEEPLCDESFCTTIHNTESGHVEETFFKY